MFGRTSPNLDFPLLVRLGGVLWENTQTVKSPAHHRTSAGNHTLGYLTKAVCQVYPRKVTIFSLPLLYSL